MVLQALSWPTGRCSLPWPGSAAAFPSLESRASKAFLEAGPADGNEIFFKVFVDASRCTDEREYDDARRAAFSPRLVFAVIEVVVLLKGSQVMLLASHCESRPEFGTGFPEHFGAADVPGAAVVVQ